MSNGALKWQAAFRISTRGIQIKLLGPIYRGMPRMESLRILTAIEIAQQYTCSNLRKAARAIALIYDQALRFIVIC
jgi:hypothetical protein